MMIMTSTATAAARRRESIPTNKVDVLHTLFFTFVTCRLFSFNVLGVDIVPVDFVYFVVALLSAPVYDGAGKIFKVMYSCEGNAVPMLPNHPLWKIELIGSI